MVKKPSQSRRRLLLERLEDRLLFDGAPDQPMTTEPDVLVQTADVGEVTSAEVAASDAPATGNEAGMRLLESLSQISGMLADDDAAETATDQASLEDAIIEQVNESVVVPADPMARREIVFISTDIYDYEYLSLNLPSSVQIALITGDRDGMEQIAAALQGETGIDAIHIISHGSAGRLTMGATTVDTASLSGRYSDELAFMRAALTDDGDVLVYGCSVADGEIGQQFLAALSAAASADVAASDDLTGSEEKGGDWELEKAAGSVTTQSLQFSGWNGLLAPISITNVTGTATVAGTTLAANILGNGITLNTATFSGDNSQAGTFTSATGYTPEWLGYGSGILLSTGNTSQVIGPNTAEGGGIDAPGGFTDPDLGALGQGTSFDATSLTLTFTPTSNRVTLQFTFGSDEYNEYVYSAFNDAMGIWVNGNQMAILPSGETISVNSVNQAATYNPANGNQSRDPFPGNGVFDSASPSLYKSNSVASGTYNTGMDGFTVTMSIIANVTAGVSNTIKIGITDIQDAVWDSWLFIRQSSFEAQTIAYTDNVTTNVSTPITINALANDWDQQGDALTITHIADTPVTAGGPAVTLGSGATVQLTVAGQLLYTPLTGSTQNEIFTYTIQDTTGTTAVGFVNVAIPAPPTVDLNDNGTTVDRNNSVTYAMNSAAVALTTATASVTDVNDPTYPLLTLGLGGFVNGNSEILNIGGTDFAYGTAQTSSVTVSGTSLTVTNNGSGTITVARSAAGAEISDALMETVIRGITYRNIAPAGTLGNRTVSFTVNDGTSNSNAAIATISVVKVPPIVDLNDNGTTASRDNAVTFTEGNSPVSIATSTASVIDTNDTTYASMSITLGGFVGGALERLSLGGTEFSYGTAQTSNVTVGGTTFRIAYDGANGIAVTNNAAGSELPDADVETLIRSITYRHQTGTVTNGARTLSFVVNDSDANSNTAIATINVVGTPMAPTIDLNGNDSGPSGNFRDTFESVAYSRNDGTLSWSGSWIEGPNATDATAGDMRVVVDGTANVLRLGDDSNTGSADTIRRSADLTGYASATLSFDYRRVSLDDNTNDYILIEASLDGTTFTQIGRIEGPTNDATYQAFSANISAYISGTTTIRFTAPNSLGNNDFVLIDNVNIAAVAPTSHAASYQIGSSPVRVGSTTGAGVVAEDLNENITQAVITLTNAQTGDALSVAGTLPSGITASITGGGSVVTLSGLGTPAMYKQAIEAIGFANSNQSASLVNRTITAQLTDATALTSNNATTTITMISNAAPALDLDGGTAGNNFATSYTEDGAAASIVNTSASITDTDDANMESATIVLTNAFAGDVLTIGSLPSGISGSVDTSIANQITVTLSGSATKANYITALRAVTYSTTSNTPNTTTRLLNIFVNDGAANSNTATTSITVTATNDAPTSTNDSVTTLEDTTVVLGLGDFGTYSDPEGTAIQSVRITSLPSVGALQFFNGTAWVAVTVNQNVTAASITAGSLRFVPVADQNGTPYASVGFQVSDGSLFSGTQTLTINVTPVNDPPVANSDTGATTENATTSGNVLTNDTDPDGDTLVVGSLNGLAGNVGSGVTGTNGGTFTINSNGSYTFNPGTAFDNLAAGQTRTTSVTYVASDNQGGTSSTTLTVTVTGTNDAPVSTPISNQTSTDSQTVSFSVAGNFSDPDTTNTLTYSASGLPSGLSINATTGLVSGTIAANASVSGPYSVTVTATDNASASTSRTFTWTVTNPAPTAVSDSGATTENASTSGNVLSNDTDPDGDTLVVASVNGLAGNVGSGVTGTNGGTFTVNSNGGYAFNPGTAFDDLATGQTRTTSVTYVASDNQGGTSSATLTVTVTGTNDAPTSTAIANQSGTDGQTVSLNVSGNFSDPDTTNVLSFSASNLPPGLSINAATGLITGTIAANASVGGPYSVTVTATDNALATTSQTFIWIVTNPAPTATANTFSTTENATVSGNVLTDDSDPDGDALVVSAVNGLSGNVGASVTGTNGGVFTVNAAGAMTFNPGTAFDNLAAGETRTTSISYTISDNQGGTSTASVTVTVTGTNDAPTSTAVANQSGIDGASVSLNVAGNFSDPDATNVLTFTASNLPPGLSINATTGMISGTIAANASVSGPYSVTVTATDNASATTSRIFTWTVTNPAPTATNDTGATTVNANTSGNVLTNDTDPDGDTLVVGSVNGLAGNVGTGVTGTNGGTFTINSNGGYTFNPGTAFDDLATGQTRTTSVNYVASDNQGGTSSATLTVTVTGTNDAPVSTTISNQASSDAQTVSLNVAGNFSDPDTSNVLTFSASGLPSGLSINTSTGLITGTIAANASASGPYSVTVTATDPASATTSQTFTWTVTNPAPTATNDSGATTENASTSGNVLTNDTDPDGDVLSVSAVNGVAGNVGGAVTGTNGGSFTINSNGGYTFNPGTAFDDLAVGATRTTAVNYTVTDNQGGTSVATVTITVTGTNDAPTSTAISNQTSTDGQTVSFNVSGNFSDPDATDALTFSATGLPTGLSINPATGLISGTITANASASGPFSVTITGTDPFGAATSKSFTWTVTNPAPTATNDSGATTENASTTGNVLTNDTDPDGDTLTVSSVNGVSGNVGSGVTGTNGGTFTINSNGGYTFSPGTAFDNLAAGQTRTTSVTYVASDNQGGTSSTTLTVTVTGTNDAPVSTPISNQTSTDAQTVSLNVAGNFSDPDTTNTLTFSASGLPSGLSINATTGLISGTIAANASVSGPYSVTVTATDNASATTSRTFTWTVTNPAPTATNDTGATTENANTSGNVLTNDTDPDGDTLTVSSVNGVAGNVGSGVTGTNGGTFTINSNGGYTFNPGTAFDNLAAGATRTTAVNYTVTDNQGGSSIATVTITVTGTNDAPVSTAIASQTSVDNASVSLSVASNFSDIDATDTLTFSASNLPPGLSINATTGLISGTIAANASVGGPYSVTVTATDGASGTTSQTFTWTVTNPAPTATNDSGATTENANTSGNVLTNDSDPDGDLLVVSAVNGLSGNVDASVTGTNGGTFTVNAAGALTFNPGTAFDDLAAGETRTTSINYTISDNQGGTSSASVTVTVTGNNDAPTSTAIPNQSGSDAQIVTFNVSTFFADADTTNVLSFSASNLPPGLSINSTTGVISGTLAANASVSGPYSVTVTATDNASATTSQTFTWTVTNPAPTANDDNATIASNSTTSGNVLTNDTDPDNDTLTVHAVNGSTGNVGVVVTGSNGGAFTILANGSFTFNPGSDFDSLGAGDSQTTTVTYTMTDSQAGFSTATVTITVTGVNSAPVSTPIASQTNADSNTVTLNVSANFSDPDVGDSLTFSASNLPAGLSIHATTGMITGTIAANASASGPYSVTITATDNFGATTSQTFTWTVTNPAPTAVSDSGATTENANTSGNVLTNDTDPDGDTLTVSAINGVAGNVGSGVTGTNGGTFTINSNGGYTFNPGTAFDNLAVGQTRTTAVNYTVTDNQGGTSIASVTMTVTGTNDAPTTMGTVGGQSSVDSAMVTLNLSGFFTDADTSDVLSFSASGLPTGLSINATTGIISGTIHSSASASGPFSATVTANDGNGGTVNQVFTWIVTKPAPIGNDDSFAAGEDAGSALVGNALANDSDPDGDSLTANVQTNVAGSNGGVFSIASNGNVTFAPSGEFNDLAAGQTRTTTLNYIITDANGATDAATITVTVTGANDAPVTTGTIGGQTSNDSQSVSLPVSSFFADPDTTNVLTFSASNLPPGLSINATTGIISGTIAANASVGGPYSVTVTATDDTSATTSQAFTWNVTNPAPTATNDTGATTENANTSGNVLTNDTDPDGDTLTVAAVNGIAGNVGSSVTGTNGGTFAIASNGIYAFNPGTAFDNLAVGATRTTAVNYTVTDNQGGTSIATVTITVTGTNDGPVANADSVAADQNTTLSGNVLSDNAFGADVDADGDTLTVTLINGSAFTSGATITLSSGALLTMNDDGTFSYDPNGAFDFLGSGQSQDDSFSYEISDGNGGTATALVTITVNGLDDTLEITGLTDGSIAGTDGSVREADLATGSTPAGVQETVAGTFYLTAVDGIQQVSLNAIIPTAPPTSSSPIVIPATYGTLSITDFDPATGEVTYTYTLNSAASHSGGSVTDTIVIEMTDSDGDVVTETLAFYIIDDQPAAQNDSVSISEGSITPATGNVIGNDTVGADATGTPVSGVIAGMGSPAGSSANVGVAVAGACGSLTLAADGSYSYTLNNANSAVQALAIGESLTETFRYEITDADGSTSIAALTLVIAGTNDAPVTVGSIGTQNHADSTSLTLDASSYFADPDSSDVLTFSASNLPPGLSINATTGVISGIINSSASVGGPYSVVITAEDNHGATVTQALTWIVTNPAPIANNDSFTANEDGSAAMVGNAIASSDSDADGDSLTAVVQTSASGSNGGVFSIAANGDVTFNSNGAFEDLALGETRTTSFTYVITDADGATDSATITVTVNGANDTPVSLTTIGSQSNNDRDVVSLNVSGNFGDPDSTNALTYSASNLPTGLTINAATGLISGTIDRSASTTSPWSVTITATDPLGASTSQTFAWNVANPVPTAVADTSSVASDTIRTGNVLANDTDQDGDVLSVAAVNGLAVNVGSVVTGSNGGSFTIQSNGSYSFNPGTAFDDLAVGETRTTSVTYAMTDNQGGASSTTLTITVTGLNAAPTSTSIANQASNDNDTVSLNVFGNFNDTDLSDTLTFTASGLPSGLSINAATGIISGTIARNASVSGPYTVTVTATDNALATTSQTFSWTVTNPAPTAAGDNRATTENASISGNVLANDTDPDGDTLSVSAVNGVSANVGNGVTGTNGGSFAINSNGSYTFNPGAAFDDLAVGETRTTSVNYTMTDSQGGISSATVTVTITGTNDAPTTVGTIGGQSSIDSATVSLNVSSFFADPDTTNVLTITASNLPPGLSINSTTGVISGTIAANGSVGGPYSVTITATDNASATTSQTFTWTVANLAPTASSDSGSTTENANTSGNVLTNDTDPDGDTLMVSAANGLAGSVGAGVTGTNGGTFTINSNGGYIFNPGTAFDNLAFGANRTTAVNYTITDSQGGTSTATVTITVTGTNGAPVSTAIANQTSADSSSVTMNVAGNFSDADMPDTLTFSASGMPTGLSIQPTTGIISGTIDRSASLTSPYSVTVTGTDSQGASTSRTFTWTVTNPVPMAVSDSGATTENANTSGNVLTNDTDPDGDTLVVSSVNGVAGNVASAVAGTNGGSFTINSNGGYTFNPGTAFDDLAAGQTRTTSVTCVTSDNQGGTSSTTLTVTVTGTNDAPVSTPISNQSSMDAQTVSFNVAGDFSEPDTTNTLTFSASGLPSGLSINAATGLISGTIAANASVSGPYSVTVTATDNASATASRTFLWTVTNPAPTATNDSGATTENANTSGNVLTNDSDPDGDTLTVSAVNGSPSNVGNSVAGNNGGTFTVNSNGSFAFNPGTAFDDLAAGEIRTTSINYSITDSEGGSSVATVTMTVTGTNDAPMSMTIGSQSGIDGTPVTLDVSTHFEDPDTTDSLTYSGVNLPPGLSINPLTGIISGTIDPNAAATGPYSVTVTAIDPHGATVSTSFVWNVENPDLIVAVSDSAASVEAGDVVVFSVDYRNISQRDATGVVITQTLTNDTSFDAASSSVGWIDNGDGTYSFTLGNVAAGESGLLLFAVRVDEALPSGVDQMSTQSQIADDGTHGFDLTPLNNVDSEQMSIVAQPDYRITISDGRDTVLRGDSLSYSIVVANNGSQTGTGVTVTSYFPPEVLSNIVPSHGGIVNTIAGTITWSLADLPAGSTVSLQVAAVISNSAPSSIFSFSQHVVVTDDGFNGVDPTPGNNAGADIDRFAAFGFDSFHNLSTDRFGMLPAGAPPLTTRLMPLPVDPIFSGITEPGTTLVGKIYDQHGSLIGERQVMADSSGNWMMSFPNSVVLENPHRMEIQQTAALQSGGHESGFNFRRYFHPAAHSSIFFTTELTVNEVFRRSAYQMVKALHEGNQTPYGFAWYAHAYELAAASSNAGQG